MSELYFVCDNCGEVIPGPAEGFLDYEVDLKTNLGNDPRIVHRAKPGFTESCLAQIDAVQKPGKVRIAIPLEQYFDGLKGRTLFGILTKGWTPEQVEGMRRRLYGGSPGPAQSG